MNTVNKKQTKRLFNLLALTLIAAGICYVCSRFIHLGRVEYTDDARVRQQITPVNSRVQGFITKVFFSEFQPVHKGDTLLVIEDAEYRLRLAQAQAEYANASAGSTAAYTSVHAAANNIKVNEASIEEVEAQLENAKADLERYENLLAQKAVTRQQYDKAQTAFRSLKARYDQMNRLRTTSSLVHAEQTDRLSQSKAAIALAQAQVELAALNLSYTVITAPCDGYTARKEVLEGQLIQPGQKLLDIVNTEQTWVVANYRESQIKHIHPESEVEITVDALPGIRYKGRVERLSNATEASYSPIPSGNAAGNFVKVEQRIPVRIVFTHENRPEDLQLLRSGLNVECTIRY